MINPIYEKNTSKPIPGNTIQTVVLDLFSAMKPVMRGNLYSPKLTLEAARDSAGLRGINAAYSIQDIRAVLTNYYSKGLTHGTTFGALTPLGLYALKNKYGLKYNWWDKEDPLIKYFIGKTLFNILQSKSSILEKQKGLANVSKRLPGIMILDIKNWDKVPKALDCEVEW